MVGAELSDPFQDSTLNIVEDLQVIVQTHTCTYLETTETQSSDSSFWNIKTAKKKDILSQERWDRKGLGGLGARKRRSWADVNLNCQYKSPDFKYHSKCFIVVFTNGNFILFYSVRKGFLYLTSSQLSSNWSLTKSNFIYGYPVPFGGNRIHF